MMVLDFDGTLIDVWKRYYKIFCEGLENRSLMFPLEEYKLLKRKFKRDEDIARFVGTSLLPGYFESKKAKLENMEYLALDKSLLTAVSSKIIGANQSDFVILSARRRPDILLWEVDRLGIPIPLNQVYAVNPDDKDSKTRWFIEHKDAIEYIIGDSKVELHAFPGLDVKRVFVDTGLFCFNDISTFKGLDIKYSKSVNDILRDIYITK